MAFLSDLGSDLWVRVSLSDVCADLTDVTLADEDTNPILAILANLRFINTSASQSSGG